jgi:SAM-dependent methyltransferase
MTASRDVRFVRASEGETLLIDGAQAMQAWEADLMRELADLLRGSGGDFLEVGLGFGYSALRIAGHPQTRSHLVLEKYQVVIDNFRQRHPKPPDTLTVKCADVFDVFGALGRERYDGIFFDPALPMSVWRDARLWEAVMPSLRAALRPGGRFAPFFTTRPVLRAQFAPWFEEVSVYRRRFEAYEHTSYTHGRSGDAYLQVYRKSGSG